MHNNIYAGSSTSGNSVRLPDRERDRERGKGGERERERERDTL